MSASTKNINSVIRFEMLRRRKSLIIWCAVMFGVMALYMVAFPFIENMPLDMLQNLPEEMFEALGLQQLSDMQNFNKYFAMEFQIFIVILCGYAVFASANIMHDEEARGSVEFLASINASRMQIITGKIITVLISILCVVLSVFVGIVFTGLMVAGDTINIGALAFTFLMALVVILFFACVGFFLSSLLGKTAKVGSLAIVILIATYIMGYMSTLGVTWLEFTIWLSPVQILPPTEMMAVGLGENALNVWKVLLLISASIGLATFGILKYRKKDLQ
ncbi:MAG: ABC transporter permease subunit [Bacilli bacterium]